MFYVYGGKVVEINIVLELFTTFLTVEHQGILIQIDYIFHNCATQAQPSPALPCPA